MPGYLFLASALLFLLVFCALYGAASAVTVNKSAKLFEGGLISVLQPKGDDSERSNVKNYGFFSVVGTGDVMVALVDVGISSCVCGILTKYVEVGGDEWGAKAIEDDGRNWKAQWALKTRTTEHIAFAPVARDNSVYVLSAMEARFASLSFTQQTTKAWDLKLTVGRITDSGDAAGKKIEWRTKDVSDCFITKDFQENIQGLSPFDGSAFVTEDETFVFVLRAWNGTEDKNVFVIAHSKDPSNYFTFTYVNTIADCYSDFFSWGEQLFMVPVDYFGCNSSKYKLLVSNDMGKTWESATGPLAERLLNLTKRRSSFIRITIEGRRVLLFIKEVSKSGASQGNISISLFMADDNHVVKVMSIVSNVTNFYGGLLFYTNDELFFSNVRYEENGITVFITRLKKQLKKLKCILSVLYPDDS